MEPLRPLFWGQGMLLQPQHFQQQDRYHEACLRYLQRWLHPFCWGVKTLTINESALRTFMFEIEQCELVTQEGTIICFQEGAVPGYDGMALGSNARIVRRSCQQALDPGGRPLAVYLGLKRLQWQEPNVNARREDGETTANADLQRRFSLQEATTPDLFSAYAQERALQYLLYEVHLLFGEEQAHGEDYELVKIAEVLRAEGQGAVLSRQYIPPCLTVSGSSVLQTMLKELRDLLIIKGREFAEYKRQRRISTIQTGSREAVYVAMMQIVNRYMPLFRLHLEGDEPHPYVLYALLWQLVGELSTFSETISVLDDPMCTYSHDRLWECFDPVVRVAKELFNEFTRSPGERVPLVFESGGVGRGYFAANLTRRTFEGNRRYYLSIKADVPPEELQQLPSRAKIGSREDIPTLRDASISGLKLTYLPTPPEELPRGAQSSYFAIDRKPSAGQRDYWRNVEQGQNIALYWGRLPQEAEIQLFVLSEA